MLAIILDQVVLQNAICTSESVDDSSTLLQFYLCNISFLKAYPSVPKCSKLQVQSAKCTCLCTGAVNLPKMGHCLASERFSSIIAKKRKNNIIILHRIKISYNMHINLLALDEALHSIFL